MIGVLGERYVGIERYGTTDSEIFEDLKNCDYDNDNLNSLCSFTDRDFMDTSELEEELIGGAA